ncbi:MAG: helix-turn-helix domain-containing protein [Actinobacteria bacterium]|nr:helix-turn-helix domain-containing protein [Actinomycetota bacterium]
MKDVRSVPAAHWLSVGEASAILGVSTATMRRWAVEGRLASFTTQGGHRRFARSSVEALLPRPVGIAAAIATVATADQIGRAYRQSLRVDGVPLAFLDGVPSGAREPLRTHGRVITTSILKYLEAGNDGDRDVALAEGLIAAAAYGRIAAGLGATMRETVATFVRFRMPFVQEMAGAARRQGLDTSGATDLLEAVWVAIDRVLDATLEGFEQATTPRAGRTRGARTGGKEPRR